MKTVAFRVDATPTIGSGHFSRCLALAQSMRGRLPEAEICFIAREVSPGFEVKLKQLGFALRLLPKTELTLPEEQANLKNSANEYLSSLNVSLESDAAQTAATLGQPVDLLVVDHYAIDRAWHLQLKSKAKRIFVIDDIANRSHEADLLLDQNLPADAADRYSQLVPPSCAVLSGPQFALLDPQFEQLRRSLPERRTGNRLLISLGGGDYFDAFRVAIKGALAAGGFQITAVVPSDRVRSSLDQSFSNKPNLDLRPYTNSLPQLICENDIALGAGGVSNWERCCLAVPSVVVSLAANQERNAKALHQAGAAAYAGGISAGESNDGVVAQIKDMLTLLRINESRYREMSSIAGSLVDGEGTARVTSKLVELCC
jgi:UDP-2,4-diacetamido-2,4,6-trideoxy-beta-L-altropyranose hydrolase